MTVDFNVGLVVGVKRDQFNEIGGEECHVPTVERDNIFLLTVQI